MIMITKNPQSKSFKLSITAWLILFINILSSTTAQQVKVGSSVNPEITTQLLQSSQYFFIPLGSFLQFSLGNWQVGQNGDYLSQVTISYNITVMSPSPNYNFMVLQASDNNPNATNSFNCYVRAVNEGVNELMNSCNFSYSPNPSGKCGSEISNLGLPLLGKIFMNCSDTNITFNFTLLAEGQSDLDGTLLFIVDNSGLFPKVSQPTQLVNLIVEYEVITDMNEGDRAKFYLFCGLTGILIVILIILAAVLNCKIRRIDKLIEEERKDKSN